MVLSNNINALIYKSKKRINVENLIRLGVADSNHTCVVIDTGVAPHIDYCLGRNRVFAFVDLVNDKSYMYDDNGHGTFVTGVICGCSLTDKYGGIDNKCNIIGIKALTHDGNSDTDTILRAINWVYKNAKKYNIKVVCMSFGSVLDNYNDPLMKAVEVLWDSGIVVVCAGGNSGPSPSTIMSPGACRKIITVGSVVCDSSGCKVADFSSRGPVGNYYKPDIVVPGVDVISTAVFGIEKKFYTSMTGTSVSAPIVAGVVSLLLRVNPNYTPDQIKTMLISACVPIDGDRNSEGYGFLDLSKIKVL
ncbi:MAG: peptidase S8 [Clostridiales bacterium]|nr:peptidase S8 [Clostridiales bacterium]